MRQFRKSTIKEVAAKAGVSTATVSYFISGRDGVCSPETAQRIQSAVAELKYAPSSLSRGLRQQRTTTFGLCMLAPSDPQVMAGNFFLERLSRGIIAQADAANYSLLLYPASVREGKEYDAFLDGRVDGLLFHPHDNARTGSVAAAGMPIVLMTRSLDLPEGCGAVWADEAKTVDLALTHLWNLGHRRIAHVAGPVGAGPHDRHARDIAVQRLNGYCAWMLAKGIYDPGLIGYAESWTGEHMPDILSGWHRLPEPPTAVFCVNDALAIHVMETARVLGWRVPSELSVIGVDNSPQSRDSRPALTSVNVPLEEMGREAVNALLRMMQGAPVEQCRAALPVTDLVVRQSTARSPGDV